MAILESIVGHDRIISALLKALEDGRLPSQFLFVGPEGVGKKRVAWGLAQVLLCSQPTVRGVACGQCPSCYRVQSGFHENILLVEPEKNLIKLEKAREIQEFLSLAQDRGARIIIVDEAHALNAQAANSLLKVFEEPPANTYFFFITHRWTQVLPTVRSRATRVAFSPLSEKDLFRWSEGDAVALHLARGSVKELVQQKQESWMQLREEAYSLFHNFFADKDFFLLGDWRENIKDRDRLLLLVRYWLLGLRDFFLARASQGQIALSPHLAILNHYPEESLWRFWERGLQLEAGILGYRDPVLLMEEWLIPLLESEAGVEQEYL